MGSIKNKPWDDVIQFDDWKKEEVPIDESNQVEQIVENSAPAEIQGIGINRNIEENEDDLFSMIANLNAGNSKYAETVAEKEKREAEREHAQERQKEAEAIANAAREKYEQEQAERDRMAFEKAQEEAERNAELQAKKEKSIAHKLTSLISSPGKKKKSAGNADSNKEKDIEKNPDVNDELSDLLVNDKEDNSEKDSQVSQSEIISEDSKENISLDKKREIDETEISDSLEEPLESSMYEQEEISAGKVEAVGKRKHKKKKQKESTDKVSGDFSITGEKDLKENEIANDVDTDTEEKTDKEEVSNLEKESLEEDAKPEGEKNNNDSDAADKAPEDESKELEKKKSEELQKQNEDSQTEKKVVRESSSSVAVDENDSESSESAMETGSKDQEKKKKSFWDNLFKKQSKDSTPEEANAKLDESSENEAQVSSPDWEFIATHDGMTGLLNQNAYEQAKKEKREKPYAVVVMDVNNLKYANDTYGHEAGNKLIIAVSEQVKALFPDCGYRTGGDEFVAIVPYKKVSKIETEMTEKKKIFLDSLQQKTKEDKDSGLVYSASFGYSYSDGKKPFAEVAAEADKAMYQDKEAYKKANPQFDMRKAPNNNISNSSEKAPSATPEEGYDELLTDKQKELKKLIQDRHIHVSNQSTMEIVREVQRRSTEVVAILIASPSFDHLFIILSADSFCDIVSEYSASIDFSYLYIIYKDGAQYKGSDEYLADVTDLFEALGKGLLHGKIKSEKDILKIKGINIFKQIYIA